jgi:hypothetical protein
MTRMPMLTLAMMTVASAALAQSNPNPGAVPNTGISPYGPTYTTPGQQGGTTPSLGGGTSTGPTFTTPAPPPNSTSEPRDSRSAPRPAPAPSQVVPPNSITGHPPDETRGSGAAPR